MKILMTRNPVAGGGIKSQQDYLSDCVFYALRQLLGENLVDAPRLWYMYKDEFGEGKKSLSSLYGRGMTLFGNLPELNVDRDDIESKIRNHYFDVCIMSQGRHYITPYKDLILQHYKPNEIICLDGHDYSHYHEISQIVPHNKAIFFKRELAYDSPTYYHPISFAFPREKLQPLRQEKIRWHAHIDPRDKRTYVHQTEETYYEDYNISHFAYTMKKTGWDCMRHYEIMGARCLPLFLDILDAPERTMTTLPKKLLTDLLLDFKFRASAEWFVETSEGQSYYKEMSERIFEYFDNHCLTEHLAEYVLSVHQQYNRKVA